MSKYKKATKKKVSLLIFCLVLVLVFFILDLITGPADISIKDLGKIMDGQSKESMVFFRMRLPVSLTALTVGAALGLSGALMQTLLANPLASPYTLGISSAASFGAASCFLFSLPMFFVSLGAFLFSILATYLIYLASKAWEGSNTPLILTGITVKFLFDALLSLVQYLATDESLDYIVFWTMGSLNRADYGQIWIILIAFILVFMYLIINSWSFTALKFGEERARSLGVNVTNIKTGSLTAVSLLTSICVSFCGSIGFIGLAAPHIARRLVGDDQRFYFSFSAIFGSLILLISSIISKSIKPGALIPIGIISSLIGIPFMIMAIFDKRRLGKNA